MQTVARPFKNPRFFFLMRQTFNLHYIHAVGTQFGGTTSWYFQKKIDPRLDYLEGVGLISTVLSPCHRLVEAMVVDLQHSPSGMSAFFKPTRSTYCIVCMSMYIKQGLMVSGSGCTRGSVGRDW